MSIVAGENTVSVSGEKIRSILGNRVIKSTLFAVETSPDMTITFKGKGSGHGMGLCQVGAKGLASAPFNYSYDRILAHYFPGTEVSALPSMQPVCSPPVRQDSQVSKAPPVVTAPAKATAPPVKDAPPVPGREELKIQIRIKAPGGL